MTQTQSALVEALYRVPEHGKAEIIDGEVVRMSPTGIKPGRAGGRIYLSLQRHEEVVGGGYAFPDNVGFVVDLPRRGSFSPDAGWCVGNPNQMGFADGAPVFAVEVRSEGDYGPRAERAILAKIKDYFAAGTVVVWDVDVRDVVAIKKYTAAEADGPALFQEGDVADAEPAVPGWRFPVDNLLARGH